MSPILDIAKRQCRAARPSLTLKAFVKDTYGVSYAYLCYVASGRRRPSPKLLTSMRQAHARLFPSEPFPLPPAPANPALN